MARYRESVCRLCRREGVKLFLKGERCLSKKCALDRRSYPPGQAGQARKKVKEYGTQLREKQKVKRLYGTFEKQFRAYFARADRMKGITGENLLTLLETRLDNVVLRLGFAASLAQARQLVSHRHFLVNGRMLNVPSYKVRKNDTIEVIEASRKLDAITTSMERVSDAQIPEWLGFDRSAMKGTALSLPLRDHIQFPIQEQLIVELYSK